MNRDASPSRRCLATGARNALLSPMAREEIRAMTLRSTAETALNLSELVARTLWIMLVSDHVAQHHAAPSESDCEGYRLFAELCMGDAVDMIDQRIRDCTAQRGHALDPFLQEARSLKRFADEIVAREVTQSQQSVQDIRTRAITFMSHRGPGETRHRS
jgi:hypothetical protein